MSKYDINEAFIQALQEQEKEDTTNNVLKLSDKMKEIPVKKGSITATPSIERTMRTAKDRRDKKQEEASITVTQDVNSEEEALDLVNDSSYFKVGDEVKVNDWNGRTYKVKKTKDYKYKDGKRIEEESEKKDEILDVSVNANDIGSNNNTNLDLGGLGDLGSLLGEEKKEELFNVNIDAGDIASNNSTSLDLGGIGALAGLLASEEVKEDDDKLEEDTEEYLEPRFDSRNSFYKKAKVVTKDNGDEELYSYGTHVGGIRGGKPYSKGRFSQTTSRHQKEFFKQRDINPNDVEVEESKKTEDVEYISKKELDDMPAEYKSTVKDSIDAEVWKGNDRKKVTKLYKDLGYDEDDPMILALDNEKGTVLKPVKVKEESKLQEVEIKDGENTETITGLHTDLFKLVNMYQYQIADGIMCDRDELDATMRKYAEPIIEDAFHTALPSSKVTFGEFDHPPYYKLFTNLNDQLLFSVTFDKAEYEALKEKTINDPAFADYIAQNYCSYDGFISYMADNMDDFNKEEDWRQFVQVVQYNMPEFTEDDYDRFVSDVVEDLYENFDTEEAFIEYALENIPEGADVETWVKENANVSENYDLDWVIETIKDELKDRNETPKDESKKTEDINEEDEEEEDDPYGETISLLAIAYRDIPEVGVEDWGKDNELKFCLDIRKVLSDLEVFEEEIPKKLYDEASPDDWSNGVEEYLETFKGVDINSGKSDNSYNWGSRLTHDVELTTYETEDAFYVKMSVHREGDVRGNYTNDFLLVFDTEEQFYEEILESQSNNCNYVEIDDKSYRIEADFFSEYCNIWCDEDNKSWDDVVCTDIDELKELIATDEGTQY